MSLQAEFAKESDNIETIESEKGYATYKFFPESRECYIMDIYVRPEYRQTLVGSQFVDQISDIARSKDLKFITTSSIPSFKGCTVSTKAILSYGFQILRSEVNKIWFVKDL